MVAPLDLRFLAGTALALATAALGLATALRLPGWLPPAERVVSGLVIGVIAVDAAGYVLALGLGVNLALVLLLAGLALGAAAILFDRRRLQRFPAFVEGGARRAVPATVVVLGAVLAYLFGRAIVVDSTGWFANYNNVWADWSFHASAVASFVYGQNLPPQNPVFAGMPFRYPFLPDFASALLVAGGWSLPASLIWPGWTMVLLALTGLVLWARRLTGGIGAGVVAVTLTLFGGGLGFWFFFGDAAQRGLLQALGHISRSYDRFDPPVNIQWYNPLLSYYLPQRSFVFGAAIAVAVLLLLTPIVQSTPLLQWRSAVLAIRTGIRRPAPTSESAVLLLAGVLVGLLPWFHVHSLVVLGVVTVGWAILFPRPGWIGFGLVVLILALPRLLFAAHGDPTAPLGLHYPRVKVGWLADGDNPVWFWIKNTGAFWPLLLIALLSPLALRARSRLLLAPFIALFILANLVVFQPWDWDNTKILIFWYLAGAVAVGALLGRLWRVGIVGKLGAAGLWLSLVAAGVLSLAQAMPLHGPHYLWFSADDVQFAAQVRALTPTHAVFLTGDEVTNPVAGLAGRAVVMGYPGWLWTEGIDYAPRAADMRRMYQGLPDALVLLHRYQVNYVLIGPQELSAWHANVPYFAANFPLLIKTSSYQVYRVSASP